MRVGPAMASRATRAIPCPSIWRHCNGWVPAPNIGAASRRCGSCVRWMIHPLRKQNYWPAGSPDLPRVRARVIRALPKVTCNFFGRDGVSPTGAGDRARAHRRHKRCMWQEFTMEKVVPQFNDGGTSGIVPHPQQHERYVQLKKMLDDSEWASAYDDRKELHQALVGLISAAINNELELDQETLQILALEAEDYEDFRAFREEWIRGEDAVPGTSPEAWLRARLRAWDKAQQENLARTERYQGSFWSGSQRFRVR